MIKRYGGTIFDDDNLVENEIESISIGVARKAGEIVLSKVRETIKESPRYMHSDLVSEKELLRKFE